MCQINFFESRQSPLRTPTLCCDRAFTSAHDYDRFNLAVHSSELSSNCKSQPKGTSRHKPDEIEIGNMVSDLFIDALRFSKSPTRSLIINFYILVMVMIYWLYKLIPEPQGLRKSRSLLSQRKIQFGYQNCMSSRQSDISSKDAHFRYFANINCSNACLIAQICAREIRFAHQTIGNEKSGLKREAITPEGQPMWGEDRQRRKNFRALRVPLDIEKSFSLSRAKTTEKSFFFLLVSSPARLSGSRFSLSDSRLRGNSSVSWFGNFFRFSSKKREKLSRVNCKNSLQFSALVLKIELRSSTFLSGFFNLNHYLISLLIWNWIAICLRLQQTSFFHSSCTMICRNVGNLKVKRSEPSFYNVSGFETSWQAIRSMVQCAPFIYFSDSLRMRRSNCSILINMLN